MASHPNKLEAATRYFRAPGRVNIIGEHTDYNDGFVLPTNTALYTNVKASSGHGNGIRAHATLFDESAEISPGDARFDPQTWTSYVGGVANIIHRHGIPLQSADLYIDGEIPIGGGLSSSASLELAVAIALLASAGANVEAATLARWCQEAEREFAGVHCGIMDQYSVACGKYGQAMLLDCRTLDTDYAPIPETLSLLVVDSGVKHALPVSGYNDRADECRGAVSLLLEAGNEIGTLRDASEEMIEDARGKLGSKLFRRARHVVTENRRTLEAFSALRADRSETLGRLVSESHASLRDDYEVSCPEVDDLVELAQSVDGVLGARMVGGGFGGCILAVVDRGAAAEAEKLIAAKYRTPANEPPWTHIVAPADAAGEVDLQ